MRVRVRVWAFFCLFLWRDDGVVVTRAEGRELWAQGRRVVGAMLLLVIVAVGVRAGRADPGPCACASLREQSGAARSDRRASHESCTRHEHEHKS